MGLHDFQRKLDEFQKNLDVPKWYLGISDYQESAIRNLCDDLRDDFEQGTSFRVEKALGRLGLSPLISKKKIRTMVQLSRGNDLAFLFFTLEGYYVSSRKDGEYTTNEKLLMIAMAKIDLLPTLRELDRILPPPQLSAADRKRQNPPKERKSFVPTLKPFGKPSKKSPYFQRQPRPKEIVVDYMSKPPNHIATFPFWPLDKPPDYGPPTKPPWFAEYNLNPIGRLVKSTVGEAVDKYFNNMNQMRELEIKARKSRKAASTLENARKSIAEDIQLCNYHQWKQSEEQLLRDELTVLARNRVIDLMDVTLPYSKLRKKRILSQLEHDIDVCLNRYNMKMQSTTVHTIAKADCVLCQEMKVALPAPKRFELDGRILVGEELEMQHTEEPKKYVGTRLTGGGLRREPVDFGGEFELNCQNLPKPEIEDMNPKSPDCEHPTVKGKGKISFFLDNAKLQRIRENRKEKRIRVLCEGKQTKKTFFMKPSEHKPYLFKYKRIFKSGLEKPRDVERVIAKAFVKALKVDDNSVVPTKCGPDADMSEENGENKLVSYVSGCRLTDSCSSTDETSDHENRPNEDHRGEIIKAVVRCAKEVWMKGVNMKRAEMEEEERIAKIQRNSSKISYDIQYFNPDDSELMNRMLEDGLKQLRKNQRFVLASLPNAHKLPTLQQWIKRRYGKEYTQEEVQKSIRESLKIFELITQLQSHPPQADLMGMDQYPPEKENYNFAKAAKAQVSSDCSPHFFSLLYILSSRCHPQAEKVRAAYYKKLNDIYMQHTKACWHAMGNYLCPGGPPRKVFFAYMAGNTRDIMRNRVWNGEFRNHRQFRLNYKQAQNKK